MLTNDEIKLAARSIAQRAIERGRGAEDAVNEVAEAFASDTPEDAELAELFARQAIEDLYDVSAD